MATLLEQVRKREMEFETQQAQKIKEKKDKKKQKLINVFKEIWKEHQERRIAVLRDECEKALNRIGEGHDAAYHIMQNQAARAVESAKKKEACRQMESVRFKVALQKERIYREQAAQHRVIAKRRKSAKDSAANWQRSFGRFMSHNSTFKAISKRVLDRELPGGLFAEQSDNHSFLQPSDYKHTFLHSRLFVTDEHTEKSADQPIMNAWKAAEVQREAITEYNAMQNEIKNVMENRKNLRGKLAESQVQIEQKMQQLEQEEMIIEKAKKEQQRSVAILQQSQILTMEELNKAAKHSPHKSETVVMLSPHEAKVGTTETGQNTVKITSKDRGMLELSTSGGDASKDVKIAIQFADSNGQRNITPGKKKPVSSSAAKQVTSPKASSTKGTPRSPKSNSAAPKQKAPSSAKTTPKPNISAQKHDQTRSLSERQNEHKTKGSGSSKTVDNQAAVTATRSLLVKTVSNKSAIKVSNRGVPYSNEARSITSQSPDSVIKSDPKSGPSPNTESKNVKKNDRNLKSHTGKDGSKPMNVVVQAIKINKNSNDEVPNADREVKVTKTSARTVKKHQPQPQPQPQPRSLNSRDKSAPKTRQAPKKQTRDLQLEGNAMEDVQDQYEETQDDDKARKCRELVNTCRALMSRSMDSDQMDIRGWSTSSCIVTTEDSRPASSVANRRRKNRGLQRQDSSNAAVYKSGNTEVKALAAELARLKSCSLSSMDSHLLRMSHMDRDLTLNDSVQLESGHELTISPRRNLSSRAPEHVRIQDSGAVKQTAIQPYQPTSIKDLAKQVVSMASQRPFRDIVGSPWSEVERDNNDDVPNCNAGQDPKLIDDSMNSILATLSQEVKKLDLKLRSVNLSKTQKSTEFPLKDSLDASEKIASDGVNDDGSITERGKASKLKSTYGLFKYNESSVSTTPVTGSSTCDTDRSSNDVGPAMSFGHAYLRRVTT